MTKLLAALLVFSSLAAARAENFNKDNREFYSKNGIYTLKAGYSAQGGGGRARLELHGAGGKKISVFETERAPFTVTISGDGQRLFFFCGAWGQSVTIYTLNVHSASGELLAGHQVQMQGPAGEDFSEDFSVYALGADQGSAWSILVLNAETGELLWRKKFKEKLAGLKLSGSGERLLALFITGESGRRAVVFDKEGKELWSKALATGNNLVPRFFSGDGSELEIVESKMVYEEKDGYWHDKVLKKHVYRFSPDGSEEPGSEISVKKPK
ncbi:MAG: hypothetical protein PHV36_06635 [Elusimicrobiales bacterium]|nr:hypothetical protein [Elusimicrobiales bacterium]